MYHKVSGTRSKYELVSGGMDYEFLGGGLLEGPGNLKMIKSANQNLASTTMKEGKFSVRHHERRVSMKERLALLGKLGEDKADRFQKDQEKRPERRGNAVFIGDDGQGRKHFSEERGLCRLGIFSMGMGNTWFREWFV